ncbi:MAG TPA: LamG-like jellyroll fold domain-containing protein, partial [Enhygromyxa sp.]|nr:LamG-like jellyroll fold domain-containing protein [Enhygromyxa sp.]
MLLVPLLVSLGPALSACADDPELEPDESSFRNLDDDLELHWSFEDRVGNVITDLSGNGRHGTLNGGAFVSSPLGEAVSLDGVDDYVALTHLGLRAPTLYGGVTGNFTISARVRVDDVDKLNTLCFGCGPFSAMYVGTAAYPAKVMTALFNQQTNGSLYPLSSAALVDDEWREVTLVVDGGGSARYYLDCAVDTELANANIGLKDYNSSTVGRGAAADRWFGGEIDQLRVWSRALSEADVAELCPQTPPLEQGLQLHWTFEDHEGTQVTDLSGNERHGTVHGGAFVSSPNGEAVSLDGVDDYIAFTGPRSPALYGGVNGDFTISARVRIDELNKYNTLCYGCGPSSTWFVGDEVHGGRTSAAFLNQSTNGTLWTASNPAMSEDQWTEVTMVVDGGVAVRNYFNCSLDSERLNSNIGLKDFNYSSVGLSANAARWFGGKIDELRVWDRALSEQEIALLCDACLGPLHVDVDAPPGGDGQSWATAFDNLQDAIDASVACEDSQIWVAEGTYAPDPNAPVATISDSVEIYGGFAGTETSLAQRDFVAHPVQLGAPGWQSRVVVIDEVNAETNVRLDGFTITGSEAGAILFDDGHEGLTPTIGFHNLVITNNSAEEGAGIYAPWSVLFRVENSHFEGNVAAQGGSAISFPHARAVIVGSTFVANEGVGAAVHNQFTEFSDWSYLEISDSVLSGNVGGAIVGKDVVATNTDFNNNIAEQGGAIYALKFGLEVHDCSFTGNHADEGGALHLDSVYNYSEHYEIHDSSFEDNTARLGGAIYYSGEIDFLGTDTLSIEASDFSGNTATQGGGAMLLAGIATLDDVSVSSNSTAAGGGGAVARDRDVVERG